MFNGVMVLGRSSLTFLSLGLPFAKKGAKTWPACGLL